MILPNSDDTGEHVLKRPSVAVSVPIIRVPSDVTVRMMTVVVVKSRKQSRCVDEHFNESIVMTSHAAAPPAY